MFMEPDWLKRVVYALPLSIISSAIVIAGIKNTTELKREFLAYESSFSDIVGFLISL
jgi:hypothetical protein